MDNNFYQKEWSNYDIPPLTAQIRSPIRLIARAVDLFFSSIRPHAQTVHGITIVCISDTHNLFPSSIPSGDILIHAGDLTNNGLPSEIQAQYDWLLTQPHKYKIVISGNHDPYFKNVANSLQTKFGPSESGSGDGIIYLQPGSKFGHDGSVTLDFSDRTRINGGKIKIWGDPHTPDILGPEHVFQYDRKENFWSNRIPEDADVVVTHGPPACHLDLTALYPMGDEYLLEEVRRVKPLMHVFGHIHAGKSDWVNLVRGGQEVVRWDDAERIFAKLMRREGSGLGSERTWPLLLKLIVAYVWSLFADLVFAKKTTSTRMVNAGIVYCNTGKLGNEAQVVHI